MKQVKVMIVDDSLLFREIMAQEISQDVNVKVVGKASDAIEASRRIADLMPDVLIVDVIMDKLDGIDFVKQLLPQYYVPVIMVSSQKINRERAEAIPSVTFFQKPTESLLRHTDLFFNTILAKIRTQANQESFSLDKAARVNNRLVAMGASTGGAEALETVLTALPSTMPPIVISQHMPPKFTRSFAERLNTLCRLSVKEAVDREVLIPGQVYIAPGGYHMSVRRRGNRFVVQCELSESSGQVTPNIDILLQSAAAAAGEHAVGVLLTGMGRDGAAGLMQMRQAGAVTIGQDEASSVIYGMPKAAYDIGAVDMQVPLGSVAKKITELVWK